MSARLVRVRLSALFVVATLAATLVVGSAAGGDPISDKRAEAEKVADELEELQMRAEIITEEYNDARLALETVKARVVEVQDRAERTRARLDRTRTVMAQYAVSAYVLGGQEEPGALLDAESSAAYSTREGYAAAARGSEADALDALRAAKAAFEADQQALADAQEEAEAAQAEVAEKRDAAEAAVARQDAVLDRVEGELATLVAEEQRRRAEEEARRAAALAAQLAAQQQAAQEAQATQEAQEPGADPAPAEDPAAEEPAAEEPAAEAPADPAPPVGVGADAAINAARSVLGVRYTWGGESPSTGFDCSGLVLWAWAHGGKSLPHSSRAMYSMSRRIPMSDIQPGDLIFYGSPVHHVALYIGGGQIIHAPNRRSVVRIDSVYYWSSLVGAGRV